MHWIVFHMCKDQEMDEGLTFAHEGMQNGTHIRGKKKMKRRITDTQPCTPLWDAYNIDMAVAMGGAREYTWLNEDTTNISHCNPVLNNACGIPPPRTVGVRSTLHPLDGSII